MCQTGGEIYNIYDRPPKVPGRCDNDGGELIARPDDREEIIAPRLSAYEHQTQPLVSFYRAQGVLQDVDASGSVEGVTQRVLGILRGMQ
jgi:adenylate kinase